MRTFVDSNVFVYAHDEAEPIKQVKARAAIDELWQQRSGAVSVQVLQELYVTMTRKWRDRADPVDARAIVETLGGWSPYSPSAMDVVDAIDLGRRHDLSFWDSMIVIAAKQSACDVLYTEDLNHGQVIEGVRVENPFVE